jgi:hypothetical protein
MFCSKCGTKNPDDTKYCGGCGLDVSNGGVATIDIVNFNYYGKNWKGAHVLPLGLWNGSAYYDVAVDDDYVYLIKLPPYSSGFWYGLIGLFVLNLLGVLIGAAIGGGIDTNKRESYRSSWVNEDGKIISRLFEGRIFKKIPIAELKNSAIFKKSSFKFAIGEKNYIFKTGSKQLSNFLNATS